MTEIDLYRAPVTPATFRRLPLAVRQWYGSRQRQGYPPPSELAMRCLVNDFLSVKYRRGGRKSVDGYRAGRAAASLLQEAC
jgi:hypothetical protein